MVSRNGVQFHVWPEAFVRPGIQRRGNWFYGDAGIALGFAETRANFHESAPNEMSFYVKENGRIEEPGQLRRSTLRLDGFASLNASLKGGTAVTKPLVFEGRSTGDQFLHFGRWLIASRDSERRRQSKVGLCNERLQSSVRRPD